MLLWQTARNYLRSAVRHRLPVITWLPSYTLRMLFGDIIAGLAVGMMLVPQSLAIATVAGLPPHYGLYSSFPGPFIYLFFGTCKDLNVGPTVISALVANRYNNYQNSDVASCLAFFSGTILTVAGFLNLGFVVRFISIPVFGGFIAAAALGISINQLQDLLGLPPGPRHVIQRLVHIFRNIKETRAGDATLGVTCLLILMSIGMLAKHVDGMRSPNDWPLLLKRAIKLLNITRSALVVILTTIISYVVLAHGNKTTFKIAGPLPKGFPEVENALRPVRLASNRTLTVADSITSFGAGLGIVPLVVYIESIAVAKALAMRSGYEVDASQELVAVGASNIFASFFGAFTTAGSFARSAVNNISGAVSPMSGIVTAGLVILALQFITSVFQYIPITVLSAMVISSVLPMIDLKLPKILWDRDRVELLPYLAAFGASFYEMEFGIIIGTAVSLCVLMFKITKPEITVKHISTSITRLQVNGPMWFSSSDTVTTELQRLLNRAKSKDISSCECLEVQLDCSKSNDIDLTFAVKLKQKILELETSGLKVTLINVDSQKMNDILRKNGIVVGDCEHFGFDECKRLIHETSV